MPDLAHTIQGQDLSFLRMVANAWGIELNAPDVYTAAQILVKKMTDQDIFREIVESLSAEELEILGEISRNGGKIPWSMFVRRFGDIRTMGASKRDRERPDLNPVSPVESLWYRAIIGRAFLKSETEPQEFVFIPDEFLSYLQEKIKKNSITIGRPATAAEAAFQQLADVQILDDSCTLLAALRTGIPLDRLNLQIPLIPLGSLLRSINLIDIDNLPNTENTRKFIETPRPKALADLVFKWMNSTRFNELRLLPKLLFEGEWTNNPLKTRNEIIETVTHIPQGQWWNLQSFIQAIKETNPDFQRPAGDYDSWFIRRKEGKEYLRGFTSWDEVEGELIRFILCGPLHWLGILDLASAKNSTPTLAFRHSHWSLKLWQAIPPDDIPQENQSIQVSSNGTILVPPLAPRSIRYQVARFGEWEEKSGHFFRYRITPESLKKAQNQGLLVSHILTILKRGSQNHLPPSLVKSVERWDKFGTESHIKKYTLLKVSDPGMIDVLRKSRANRYLGDLLNATTIQVNSRGVDVIRDVLAENGYLAEYDL